MAALSKFRRLGRRETAVWAYKEAGDRERSHELLRRVLCRYAGCDPANLRLERRPCPRCGGPHGKPVLPGTDLSFNLSHTAGAVVIAVGRAVEVGVDVEAVRALPDLDGLAGLALRSDERRALASLPKEEQARAFLDHWVRKEAHLKGRGVGIASALTAVPIPLAPPDFDSWRMLPNGWSIRDVDVGPGHVAALAATPRPSSLWLASPA